MKQMYVVGVDISKSKVDCALIDNQFVLKQKNEIPNRDPKLASYLKKLLKSLKIEPEDLLVCCEHTGIYNAPLQRVCASLGIGLWEVQALKIKRATSDLRGKSDEKDALRIADYGMRYNEKQQLYKPLSKNMKDLKCLSKSRESLLKQKVMINQQLKEAKSHDPAQHEILKASFNSVLTSIKNAIKKVEKQMQELIQQDEKMHKNQQLLRSIPGIGVQVANNFIIITNNFQDFTTAKQLACYAGVVPFENASGTIVRKAKVSRLANHKMKTLLHLAAMSTLKTKTELKNYYIRKVEEGKNKMSVINAIRNKLVHRIMSVIERQTPYIKSVADYYQNSNQITCSLT